MAHTTQPRYRYLPPHLRARVSIPTSPASKQASSSLSAPPSAPHATDPARSPGRERLANNPQWPSDPEAQREVPDWTVGATDALILTVSQELHNPPPAPSSTPTKPSTVQSQQSAKPFPRQLPTPRSITTSSQGSRKSSVTTPKADLVATLLHNRPEKTRQKKHRAATPTRHACIRATFSGTQGWLKNSEIPKGLKPKKPKHFDDTRSRLSGWATQDNGAAEQQNTSLPWTLDRTPALDWNRREPFKDGDPHSSIQAWVVSTEHALEDDQHGCLLKHAGASNPTSSHDDLHTLAPRYWVPKHIEGQSPQLFWRTLLASKLPPETIGELANANPWWLTSSPKPMDVYNLVFAAPHIAGIDPDETTEQKQARAEDRGSAHAVMLRTGQGSPETLRLARRGHTYSSKIFVREANREDMRHVLLLYNYYVSHSNTIDETEPLSLDKLVKRWSRLTSPMLLAYEKSYIIRDRKKTQETQIPEKIVGFAIIAQHPNRQDAYQHTRCMQVFTVPTHYRRGVATALMDKLNTSFEDNVRSVLINYLHDETTAERLDWMTKWLARYGFKAPAIVSNEAWKNDKCLSRAIFQKDVLEVKSTDSSDRW